MSKSNLRRGRPVSTVAGLLRKALAIVQSGWTKNDYTTRGQRRGRPCHCADGAMQAAVNRDPTLTTPLPRPKLDLLSAARAVFRKANDLQGRSIEGWNDNPARTKKDVIEGFQKAIKLAA